MSAKRKPNGSGKADLCPTHSRKGKRRWWSIFWKKDREKRALREEKTKGCLEPRPLGEHVPGEQGASCLERFEKMFVGKPANFFYLTS